MARIERQKVLEQSPVERIHNFNEVSHGFDNERMLNEAIRCLLCKNPRCVQGCPVNINIPGFIAHLKENNPDKAYEVITKTNSLPGICGRVCPQEEQCEKLCILNKTGAPVSIGALERYSADHCTTAKVIACQNKEGAGKRVAIVGSGPAGLACAGDLVKYGVEVVVYEALHELGGVLIYGIPEFRLPKKLVAQEIKTLQDSGVKFYTNYVIGKTLSMDDLLAQFDAVFVGSGAGLPSFMGIPGENLKGVYAANEYLTRVNLMKAYKKDSPTPMRPASKVAVMGAGNVAMDAARTALRLGAEKVSIIYRRSKAEMPARHEEIEHAIEEGVEIRELTGVKAILGTEKVEGLKCIKNTLGEPDASGRRRPVEMPGTEYELEADTVIMAIGNSPNPLLAKATPGLEINKWGGLVIDENTETTIPNVFAGGDAVTGAATVILAMGAGKKSAKAILERLNVLR
jgi:glutamate synthase (NADPH/NADH) small chain